MGELEPKSVTSHELGIIIDVVAADQETANTICNFARSTMALRYGYKDRIATAGNLAFPYSPSDFKVGAVYEFSVYHLLHIYDPIKLFPIKLMEV